MLFKKFKTAKQTAEEGKVKQEMLDEIHQRPEVKKTFVVCEILKTINSIIAWAFLATFSLGFVFVDVNTVHLDELLNNLIESVGGPIVLAGFVLAKLLFGRLTNRWEEKLEVLEDAGIEEITKKKEVGTYVPGEKLPIGFKIWRTIMTVITFIVAIPSLAILVYKLFF